MKPKKNSKSAQLCDLLIFCQTQIGWWLYRNSWEMKPSQLIGNKSPPWGLACVHCRHCDQTKYPNTVIAQLLPPSQKIFQVFKRKCQTLFHINTEIIIRPHRIPRQIILNPVKYWGSQRYCQKIHFVLFRQYCIYPFGLLVWSEARNVLSQR